MPGPNLFGAFAANGRKFLASTGSKGGPLEKYVWHLSSVCDLMKHTHRIVVGKLEAIQQASSIEEASEFAKELRGDTLSNSFRARGLCEFFVEHGKVLRKVIQDNDGNLLKTPLSEVESWQWLDFCDSLEARELQVADLYSREIEGFSDIISRPFERSLEEVKEQARRVRATLIGQIADFDSLATEFRKRT